LDEIEKAHLDVLNVLLQVLDDGRLTDGQGRTVDFTNTILILTSNVGAEYLQNHLDRGLDENTKSLVMNQVRHHFRPEFLNRLDDIVIFNPLDPCHLSEIVHIQMKHISKLLENRDLVIALDPSAVSLILKEAYNPLYGARPLRRYLEKAIVTQLSLMILNPDHLLKNGSRITVYSPESAPSHAIQSGSLAFEIVD